MRDVNGIVVLIVQQGKSAIFVCVIFVMPANTSKITGDVRREPVATVLQITVDVTIATRPYVVMIVRTEMQVAGNVSNVAEHFVAIVGGTMRYEPVAPASI